MKHRSGLRARQLIWRELDRVLAQRQASDAVTHPAATLPVYTLSINNMSRSTTAPLGASSWAE